MAGLRTARYRAVYGKYRKRNLQCNRFALTSYKTSDDVIIEGMPNDRSPIDELDRITSPMESYSLREVALGFAFFFIFLHLILSLVILSTIEYWPLQEIIEAFSNLLKPLLSIMASLIAIAGGGLLTWRFQKYWTSPIIRLEDTRVSYWRPHSIASKRIYRLPITNVGRRPAKNCKAHIEILFRNGDSRYEVESMVPWSGKNFPNEIDINSQEIAYVNLLSYERRNNQLAVPSEGDLEEDEVILQYFQSHPDRPPLIHPSIRPEEIYQGELDEFRVQITSENARPIQIRLEFDQTSPLKISATAEY